VNSSYVSLWLLTICFMFLFHLSLCFPRAHYVLVFHFLGLCSFPSTLSYCTSLSVCRSRSRIPLQRFWSLVYISCVLVATNLRTNITCLSSSLWGSYPERSETLTWLWCRTQEWASDIWPRNLGEPRGIEGKRSSGERTKEEQREEGEREKMNSGKVTFLFGKRAVSLKI